MFSISHAVGGTYLCKKNSLFIWKAHLTGSSIFDPASLVKANVSSSSPSSNPGEKALGTDEKCWVGHEPFPEASTVGHLIFCEALSPIISSNPPYRTRAWASLSPHHGQRKLSLSLKQLGKVRDRARAGAPECESRALCLKWEITPWPIFNHWTDTP